MVAATILCMFDSCLLSLLSYFQAKRVEYVLFSSTTFSCVDEVNLTEDRDRNIAPYQTTNVNNIIKK